MVRIAEEHDLESILELYLDLHEDLVPDDKQGLMTIGHTNFIKAVDIHLKERRRM